MIKSIGNYEILHVIAEHGPTTICVARHKKLKRKTFLKIFKSADPSLLQRFEREAQIVAELNDPHIVSIYDFGEENGLYYISMEFVEGENLKEFLEKKTLNVQQKLELAYKITQAVAILHKNNYIHRDLKPENILVDRQQNVKLTDFGIAYHESLFRMTSEGALLGTPLYMSPEQINNLPLTPASDVFSMGIIFYQLICGEHPFKAERIGEIFSQILTKPVDNLAQFSDEYPQWFLELVQRMLDKEATNRPPSALAVLEEFEQHFSLNGTTRVLPVNEEKSLNTSVVLGSLALLLLIGFLVWWFREPVTLNTTATNGTSLPPSPIDSVIAQNDSATTVLPTNDDSSPTHSTQNATTSTADHTKPSNPTNTDLQTLSEVIIKTNPWCRIYLDYQLVDSTPMLHPLKLKPGQYVLGLQNPFYPTFTQTITVKPGRTNEFEFILDSLFARLDLQVLPWGDVYIDGKYIGKTPLQKPIFVTKEKHVLEIRNDFYGTFIDTIDFTRKNRIKKQIALQNLNP